MRRLPVSLALLLAAAPAFASTQLWATINPESEGSTTGGSGYGEGRFVLNDAGTEVSFHILPGEIRGQILFGATPVRASSWGRIKRLYR